MTRESAAWREGYASAVTDFDVRPTEEQISKASSNPYAHDQKRRLSAHEIFEIRNALRFTYEDADAEEWGLQAEIMCVIVERILSRRPERVS